MKKLLKILSIFCIASMLCTVAFATSMPGNAAEATFSDVAVQDGAMAYETLLQGFSSVSHNDLSGGVDILYPDYYGGAYLGDNGDLIVLATDVELAATELATMSFSEGNYSIIPCMYSYNDLEAAMEEINSYMRVNRNEIATNVDSIALNCTSNAIIVKLSECSEERIQEFKSNVFDSDALIFEEKGAPREIYVSVYAGDGISNQNGGASVGYRAKKDGEVGFVTAAHFTTAGDSITYNNTSIASTVQSERGGDVDAAFCKITNSNYTPSNTLSGTSNTLSTIISEPGETTVINKIGNRTGHSSGTVTNTSYSGWFEGGVWMEDIVETTLEADRGDSGGIVYSYVGSTNTRMTVGTILGGDGTHTYYVKANNINAALGTSRY